jgi:preprotein translocase subunit SecF
VVRRPFFIVIMIPMRISVSKTRYIWLTLSGALMLASIVLLSTWGLRLSIDFTGGTLLQVAYEGVRPQVDNVRQLVQQTLPEVGGVSVQTAGERSIIIRTGFISNEERGQLLDVFSESYGVVIEESFESVGPVIGDELRRKSLIAIALVLLFIVAYVSYAFRQVRDRATSSWKLGVVAIAALAHDLLIVVGVFVLLGRYQGVEVGTLFVTALLTVLGFSVHDTIVVFDRLRERLRSGGEQSFAQKVDDSVQSTISRSINTSLTTLFTLLALYIWGGESIRDFTLALIIGIISGVYSSIFFANPLLLIWEKKKK